MNKNSLVWPVLAVVIQFGFYLVLGAALCWGTFTLAKTYHYGNTPQALLISGRITNTDRTEFLNDRMAVLFLKGKEVGRSYSTLQKAPPDGLKLPLIGAYGTSQGQQDGVFLVHGLNPYSMNMGAIATDTKRSFSWSREPSGSSYAYIWLGDIKEGDSLVFPIKTKNTEYQLRILAGETSSLPAEIRQPGSLQLSKDNALMVTTGISMTTDMQGLSTSGVMGTLGSTTQAEVEVNKLTIPINNCGGSTSISQRYSQTQAFVKQVNSEYSARIGVEIPIVVWVKLVAEVQAKYGFEQGQLDSRTIEYQMGAEPKSHVVYVITWKEVWNSGTAELVSNSQNFFIPFRAKTNLIFQIDSKKVACP